MPYANRRFHTQVQMAYRCEGKQSSAGRNEKATGQSLVARQQVASMARRIGSSSFLIIRGVELCTSRAD
eukprot:1353117-Prorocentrum_lima.AAC.1